MRVLPALCYSILLVTAVSPARAETPLSWETANDFVYQLQNENLTAIGRTKFDIVVIDPAKNGDDSEGFRTAEEIAALKSSPGGAKLVLAYVSIGEAENYRQYWQKSWDVKNDGKPDAGAPSWLGPAIYREWPGNYTVKYWEPDWQNIILAKVDLLIQRGFDGIYLDRIDTYEYWEGLGVMSAPGRTPADDMADFVKRIATHARVTRGVAGFAIFPQGGFKLSERADYVAVCTGIGNEDNWYTGSRRNRPQVTAEILESLDRFKAAGKVVLVIDYVRDPVRTRTFYKLARQKGYVPYATVRALNRLTQNRGQMPD